MPPNNCDPAPTPVEAAAADSACPKCRVQMEPIDVEVEELHVENLQLCPNCYLVTWTDHDGIHLRQGLPVKNGLSVPNDQTPPQDHAWMVGEPEKC